MSTFEKARHLMFDALEAGRLSKVFNFFFIDNDKKWNNMNDDHIVVFVAVCAYTASIAIVAESDKKARHRQRLPKPRFYRAALQGLMRSYHSTVWQQLLSCGSSSDFLVALNVHRFILFVVLLPLLKEETVNFLFGSPYGSGPKTTGHLCTEYSENMFGLVL